MGFQIKTDNTKKVLQALNQQTINALEICGGKAETYAKRKCPVDTGILRNSISHKVNESEGKCYIGTNTDYAPYVELGTGIYYSGGRRTSWTYEDAKGNWHMTRGAKAQPFLKPAVADHAKEYNTIIKKSMQGK